MLEQRSNEWFNERKGKFTASEIHKLLGVKGLGLTGESYCFDKAVEIVFGTDEDFNFTTSDMKRGIDHEPLAFAKFKELKEFDFIEVKNAYFFPYGESSGASPDGVVGEDAILEIKCPRPEKFFRLVAEGIDAIDKNYFYQMQMQMMCSNSVKAYFFNYLIFNGQEMWHEIEVPRCEKTIDLIKERIELAVLLRDEYVQYLINNKQF